MTTYTELAKSPLAFDTELAKLHNHLAIAHRELAANISNVYRAAGARQRATRRGLVWDADYATAHNVVQAKGDPKGLLKRIEVCRSDITAIELDIRAMDEAYTGWTRYFPSITKSHPHIHRSLSCRTLHADTVMSWAPELSGHTDAEAVDKLDEALCSVCFPSAPVALHNYVSRRTQAEQTERAVAKLLRDERKAQTQLTEAEQFRTGGRYGERVTTVAACQALIRKAVELAVEVDFWATNEPEGWDADMLARRRRNGAENLEEARKDAAEARRVLIAREERHEGYGMTAEAIDRMMDKKDKSARKEWAKI